MKSIGREQAGKVQPGAPSHAVGSWFGQPDGSYRLSPLRGGRYILTAGHALLYATVAFSLAACISLPVFSQSPQQRAAPAVGALEGKVTDPQGQPMRRATVVLHSLTDISRRVSVLTDTNGVFAFSAVAAGSYELTASFAGYRPTLTNMLQIGKGISLRLPTLILQRWYGGLAEINVTARRKPVEAATGKLTLNVESDATAGGSSAFELVQRLPGIRIDADENILLKGSASINVLVDGKMTYLSGAQLTALLKGMPAESIGKIELLSTPGAQYDASGNGGMINIVTRKSARRGYAAAITAGIGAGRYLQSADGLTGNLSTGRWNVYGAFNYRYDHGLLHRTSLRRLSNNDTITLYDRHSDDPNVLTARSYKAGVDLTLDRRQEIGVVYSGYSNDWKRIGQGPTWLRDELNKVTGVVQNANNTEVPTRDNAFNLNYRLKLDTAGKLLKADADMADYRNNSSGFIGNGLYDTDDKPLQPYQLLFFQQPSHIRIRSLKSDLVYPIGHMELRAGGKYGFVRTDNNFVYDSLLSGVLVYSPVLSNHFIYTEQVYAGYLSLARQWKNASLEAGIRIEHTRSEAVVVDTIGATTSDTKRNYLDLFPSLAASRRLSAVSKLDLSIGRRINRPDYSELNPSRYFLDKYSYAVGNPYLRPELTWKGSLTYSYRSVYLLTLGYDRTDGPIMESPVQDTASGNLTISDVNFSYREQFDVQLVLPAHAGRFWEMNAIVEAYRQTLAYLSAAGPFHSRKTTVDLSTDQHFRLPGGVTLDIQAHYTSPSLAGQYIIHHYFTADAGLKKSFYAQKLDVRLAVADLFHTIRYSGTSLSPAANVSYYHTPDSRRIRLSLVFHLGGTLNTGKEHVLEEQQRL
ncbi:MAG TPA: outer membrane beta-barrel protein [Puia sp.]|uniref:outer membrane beta-barrel protein n=1 Tax=Puia sp. TaxID=2045100 RepID=UPI002BA50FB5|nr:outer membrane beta-barrel protein [Puia sp.]HVU94710.1 outer membrane beta-barrel protein [Puia sp.]